MQRINYENKKLTKYSSFFSYTMMRNRNELSLVNNFIYGSLQNNKLLLSVCIIKYTTETEKLDVIKKDNKNIYNKYADANFSILYSLQKSHN